MVMETQEPDLSKPPMTQAVTSPSLKCDVCDRQFDRRSRLESHYKIHTGERPFACPFCGKSFTSKGNCNTHIRIHTRERPYQCTHCDRTFSQHGQLVIHTRRHTGEKPYVCHHCNKGFTCSKVLKIHIRTHTGEKPFECEHCQKGFAAYANLVVHRRTHTRERPYSCKLCGRGFEHSGNLSRHVRVHRVDNGVRCIPCGQIFTTDADLVLHTQQLHPNESEMVEDSLEIIPEQLSPSTTDDLSPEHIDEPDLSTCNDEDSNGYQPQMETFNIPNANNLPVNDKLLSASNRLSPINAEICKTQINSRNKIISQPSFKNALSNNCSSDGKDSITKCVEMEDLSNNGIVGLQNSPKSFVPTELASLHTTKNKLKPLYNYNNRIDSNEILQNNNKCSSLGALTNIENNNEDIEKPKRQKLNCRMPPKKQGHHGRHKAMSVLQAALFSPPQKTMTKKNGILSECLSPQIIKSVTIAPVASNHNDSEEITNANSTPLNSAITNLSISQNYHCLSHVNESIGSKFELNYYNTTSESTSTNGLNHDTRQIQYPNNVNLKTSENIVSNENNLDIPHNPIDLSLYDEDNSSNTSVPLNLSHKSSSKVEPKHYITAKKQINKLTTESNYHMQSESGSVSLRRKANSYDDDNEAVKIRKIISPPPLIPLDKPNVAFKDGEHVQGNDNLPVASKTRVETRMFYPSPSIRNLKETPLNYKDKQTGATVSKADTKSLNLTNNSYSRTFKQISNNNDLTQSSNQSNSSNEVYKSQTNSGNDSRSAINSSEDTSDYNMKSTIDKENKSYFPIESMRENIQRSLRSLVPTDSEDFKKRAETALLFLVGDTAMRQLGYPAKNTEQVLITILDMAGKSPCADVRVNELERLKINMFKFLEYGFPAPSSWEEYGWNGKPIECILDIISTWIKRKSITNDDGRSFILPPRMPETSQTPPLPFKEQDNNDVSNVKVSSSILPNFENDIFKSSDKQLPNKTILEQNFQCRKEVLSFVPKQKPTDNLDKLNSVKSSIIRHFENA